MHFFSNFNSWYAICYEFSKGIDGLEKNLVRSRKNDIFLIYLLCELALILVVTASVDYKMFFCSECNANSNSLWKAKGRLFIGRGVHYIKYHLLRVWEGSILRHKDYNERFSLYLLLQLVARWLTYCD